MRTQELENRLYQQRMLEMFGPVLDVHYRQSVGGGFARGEVNQVFDYPAVYQNRNRTQYLENRISLDDIGNYTKHLYNRGKDWFIERPYKGLGALGAVLGGIAGLVAGPIGVLIGGALGAGSGLGIGTAYHWAWGRGKRAPKDPEFLKGRSFGKWGLDTLEGIEIQL